ncbi:hypothetical protein ACQJBY_026261 [Aegilops geniculata]
MANFKITSYAGALVENSKLDFQSLYLRRIISGDKKNQYVVIDGFGTTDLGLTTINDWAIYDGVAPDAKLVARAKGMRMNAAGWCNLFIIVFELDRFKGSTLEVMGATTDEQGEWAIVGGTGDFAMARGVIQRKIHQKEADGDVLELTIDAFCRMKVSASTTSDTANQTQSKRAPAPHMFREIVAGEKVTNVAALEDQVSTGIFLTGKTKKYWVDERTRHNCFMLFPRGLAITWSEEPQYWTWQPLKEGSAAEAGIEMVALKNVCWLEVQGKLELPHLTPGVTYEVFFEVMLDDTAYGWSTPVNFRLKFPDGTIQQHKENLQEKPRGEWLQVKVGEVKPHNGQNGEAEISMIESDGGQWKRGLLIKGIKIIPKE